MLSKRNWIIIINNSNNNNDKLASDLLLITKLTKESYLQSISLKKNLFKSKHYLHNSFRLKKRHLISIEKIHSKKEKNLQ